MIVGGYAIAHLPAMEGDDLLEFAEILEIPDQQLLSWATNQEQVPEEQKSAMLDDVLAFRPELQQ